ncbi:RNA polymerase subunit sigma-70 [Actinomadura alba]|uniref:RNA polymerase subunit sigma-70 n=1 Tax=Actinomadura alba TaxID=406431 RepID=UPI0028B073C8|nr:RNA polymerase subunit sigma-70 [Actinomadura alba]
MDGRADEPGGAEQTAVVAAIHSGDEATFARLVEQHRHELQVHCYRMLGSFADSEDMVQEALLRAWHKRESFQGRSTFRAWLYRIATNTCLDALAGPSRAREVPMAADSGGTRSSMAEIPWLQPYPDHLLDAAAPSDGQPDAVAIARETIELAYLAAVQYLPPKQRAVLILRDVLGWPAPAAAEALEISLPSLKSALQRARATLRTHLPEQRSEWGPSTHPSDEERAVLRRFMEATERADLKTLTALLREDARQTMPPEPFCFEGRDAILAMWTPVMIGPEAWGDWRTVATAANRQPAVANYVRRHGEPHYEAVNLDVLRIENGLVAEITTFGPELFPAFRLAARL